MPSSGVKVFGGLPHTHGFGASVRLRHIRSGVERPVPFQDRFYDPNYQTMRRFDFDLNPVSTDLFRLNHATLHEAGDLFSNGDRDRDLRL